MTIITLTEKDLELFNKDDGLTILPIAKAVKETEKENTEELDIKPSEVNYDGE